MAVRRSRDLSRREFLVRSAWMGLAVPLLPARAGAATDDDRPRIRRRSPLGRTGMEVPDISFGTFSLDGDEDRVRHALDLGVTHFDTARDYTNGESERTLGRALAGSRDRVTITTKAVLGADASADEMMSHLEGSLSRLNTDYVDVFMNHAVNDVERVRNPAWVEFTTRAKEQGKIRACGFSGHAGKLAECIDAALDEDLADVLLLAYNYASMPGYWERALRFKDRFTGGFDFVAYQSEMPRLLAKARAKGVGTLVMKTRRGARYNDLESFQRDGATYEQAAFRWVLSDPNVDGLVVTMNSREEIERFVAASGWKEPTAADTLDLLRYEAANAGQLCQQGCGACVGACPAGVAIGEVLRTRMYALDYHEPEIARQEYARIGGAASACLGCADRPCQSACPGALDIPSLTRETHRLLG